MSASLFELTDAKRNDARQAARSAIDDVAVFAREHHTPVNHLSEIFDAIKFNDGRLFVKCPRPIIMNSSVTAEHEDSDTLLEPIDGSVHEIYLGAAGARHLCDPKAEISSRYAFLINRFARINGINLSTVHELRIDLGALYAEDFIPFHMEAVYLMLPNASRIVFEVNYICDWQGEGYIRAYLEEHYGDIIGSSGAPKELILRSNGEDIERYRVSCCSLFMNMIKGFCRKFHQN